MKAFPPVTVGVAVAEAAEATTIVLVPLVGRAIEPNSSVRWASTWLAETILAAAVVVPVTGAAKAGAPARAMAEARRAIRSFMEHLSDARSGWPGAWRSSSDPKIPLVGKNPRNRRQRLYLFEILSISPPDG